VPDRARVVVPFDPERAITTLARHGVNYVLIGAVAARLQGFPRMTADADITPARDVGNLQRLALALRDLDARVYAESVPEGLAFDCSAATLARAELWNFVTSAGRLHVAFSPSGTGGYDDLIRSAVSFDVFALGSTPRRSRTSCARKRLLTDRRTGRMCRSSARCCGDVAVRRTGWLELVALAPRPRSQWVPRRESHRV
jgi:hypothetical protein